MFIPSMEKSPKQKPFQFIQTEQSTQTALFIQNLMENNQTTPKNIILNQMNEKPVIITTYKTHTNEQNHRGNSKS